MYRPFRVLYRHLLDRPQLRCFRSETGFFSRLLPPGGLCFDVGANIGAKSEAMLASGMRVVAFEPQSKVRAELEARCRHYSRFTPVPAGIGEKCAELELHLDDENDGGATVHPEWAKGGAKTERVEVETLDSMIARYGRPDYCKIDVEGAELEVLRGLSQPIPLISFEYHLTEDDLSKCWQCIDYLSRFGTLQFNVASAEPFAFMLDEWLSLDAFTEAFPHKIVDSETDFYGDIFVKVAED